MWFYRIEQTINLFLYIEGNVSWKINHIQALLPFSGYNHTPSTAVIGQCLHFSGGRLQCTDENEMQCNAELLYMHFWCKVSNSFFGGKTCWLLETKWSKSNATKVLILGSVFLYILTSQMKINTLYCSSCFSFNVIAFPSGIVCVYRVFDIFCTLFWPQASESWLFCVCALQCARFHQESKLLNPVAVWAFFF